MIDYCQILSEIEQVYISNPYPWIIGYSGGKDSSAVLQMVFQALNRLPKDKLTKEIHVICNDTLVENPVVSEYLEKQLDNIRNAGKTTLFRNNQKLFKVVKVEPVLNDTFWINLIGRGYPSPNRWFRWCTERMKINPTNYYIRNTLKKFKNVIVILGTRRAESANRAASMDKYNEGKLLRKHRLKDVYVYAPISELSNDEVWAYLLQTKNICGIDIKELLKMYGNACDAGECPFIIETGTQSCGKSRFGCWVCTVVDKDKSMENFIGNGHSWMKDLLEFRNWLFDIRQQDRQVSPIINTEKVMYSSFLLKTRRKILNRLLEIQERMPIQLISNEEIKYINILMENESEGNHKCELRKYLFLLNNKKRVQIISDFNPLKKSRKRVGSICLDKASLLKSEKITNEFTKLNRSLYYYVKETN